MEKLFGPKTGETKKATALAALMPIIEQAAKAGKLPNLPSESEVSQLIETTLSAMKAQGTLDAPPLPAAGARRLILPAGSKICIEITAPAEMAL